ncbi:hypothetical protein HanXRQr2_Chr09g0417151 [Helianthus annuus]|uniref:Uncharacterized protein n=1 Tax=Helianthus annuus TaxID=4232 RepID=A0A9K3NAV6_HELAN|nr:hypothetical protein HanXRQr2_Chr09g0417151 [Helianthus annuus]KAJ0537167.1 hypothetical protein HanIR_Chr09g0449691 [Helianthus annuus]KAJ0895699.1 hypothetical protein HanPSC8_Chr09g0403491 [Helianthus annuus]
MGGLSEESRELSSTVFSTPSGAEAIIRSCSINESGVSVKSICTASGVVTVLEHFVKHG